MRHLTSKCRFLKELFVNSERVTMRLIKFLLEELLIFIDNYIPLILNITLKKNLIYSEMF